MKIDLQKLFKEETKQEAYYLDQTTWNDYYIEWLESNLEQCSAQSKTVKKLNYSEWKKVNEYLRHSHGYYKKGNDIIKSIDVVIKYKDYESSFK